jgi:hypothetical protein
MIYVTLTWSMRSTILKKIYVVPCLLLSGYVEIMSSDLNYFEVLQVLLVIIFWDVIPCSLVDHYLWHINQSCYCSFSFFPFTVPLKGIFKGLLFPYSVSPDFPLPSVGLFRVVFTSQSALKSAHFRASIFSLFTFLPLVWSDPKSHSLCFCIYSVFSLLSLLLYPENGGSRFLENAEGSNLPVHMVSHPRRQYFTTLRTLNIWVYIMYYQ